MSTSSFVKKLASNDRATRDAAFEALKKFLASKQSKLSLLDYEKLWKGLYFSMWFSDRPLPQQRLAERLGELFSQVIPLLQFETFVEAFWVVIIKEWPSIDQWRIDKFYMLIRRVVRHCLLRLQSQKWDRQLVTQYNAVLRKSPLSGDPTISMALPYHLCDLYLDEIEVVLFSDELRAEGDEIDAAAEPERHQKFIAHKRALVEEAPIIQLIEPFAELRKLALLKTLREKCAEEVVDDERLVEWGVTKNSSSGEEAAPSDDSDSDGEWNGFA